MKSIEPRQYNLRDKDVPLAVFGNGNREYGWLSNFSPKLPFRFRDWSYASSEVLYQELKAEKYPDTQKMIREANEPRRAKILAAHIALPDDWFDDGRVHAMRITLKAKFSTQMAADKLRATGDRVIVEYSKFDPFWGAMATDDDTLVGCNVLGRLLMERREVLSETQLDRLNMDV